MSEIPSYSSPSLSAARPRWSAVSVTSLILGILLCIPLITSLVAIICAIVGMKATRNSAMRGRGLAVAGLTLGILGVVIWTGIGGLASFIVIASSAPRAALHDFADNIGSGNVVAAAAECDTVITPAQLDGLRTYIVPFGTYTGLTCTGANIRATSAGETCELSGRIRFSSGNHFFNAVLIKNATGIWKMYAFHIY